MVLDVGSLAIGITSQSSRLLESFRKRYGSGWFQSGRPQLEVHFHPDLQPAAAQISGSVILPISFEGRRVLIDTPGYSGFVDISQQRAELTFADARPAEACDYFLRVCLALLAYEAGGILIHAAGVVQAGRAFLFFGPSGSGKTTAARVSPPGSVLNDDLVLLLPAAGGWHAHGTPFSNPTQVPPSNAGAPAAALMRLVQSPQVHLAPLGKALALAELLGSTPVLNAAPEPPIDRCQALLDSLPAYYLHFLPDASFWPLVSAIP